MKKILIIVLLSFSFLSQAAFNDSETDYSKFVGDDYINNGPVQSMLDSPNFLLCFLKATGASQIVNGTYLALIDFNKCDMRGKDVEDMFNVIVKTSRADNNSKQEIDMWIPKIKVTIKVTINEAASTERPYGIFDFTYKSIDSHHGTTTINKGKLFSDTNGNLSYIIDSDRLDYFKGIFDRTGLGNNQLFVNTDNASYTYTFNKNFVHYADASTGNNDKCLDINSTTSNIWRYKLFNEDGSNVNINGGFSCTYGVNQTDNHCYVNRNWAWFGDKQTGTNRPATIYDRQSGQDYKVCYGASGDECNSTANATTNNQYIGLVGYSFDPAIKMQSKTVDSKNFTATYQGNSSFYGIPWQCYKDNNWIFSLGTNCEGIDKWRMLPINDGEQFTAVSDDKTYRIKRASSESQMKAATDTNSCNSLPLANVSDPGYTSSDIENLNIGDAPTVDTVPKVIDGVVQ